MSTGSCLCGAVRYELCAPGKWMAHCHCSMCRKHHGSLYSTTLGVESENFRWLEGEEAIVRYRSSPEFERAFCRHCGSVVPVAAGESVLCPAGNLDPLETKPQAHIFAASRSASCEITDDLQQFEEYPPGYGAAVSSAEPAPLKEGVVQGSCLCGEVAFEIDEAPARMVNCHCSRCRTSRGAAHATNIFVPPDNFRWTRGEERVRTFTMPDAYMFVTAFCERCGSLMPALWEKAGMYLVPVGALDTPLELKPCVNIYTGSKAPWFEITDPLPQFEAMPPSDRFAEFFW